MKINVEISNYWTGHYIFKHLLLCRTWSKLFRLRTFKYQVCNSTINSLICLSCYMSPFMLIHLPGVHGRPYTSWNNIGGQFSYTGYCTHDSVLFPTWHRPYLALFEVSIHSKKRDICVSSSFMLIAILARVKLACSNYSAPIFRSQ